MQKMLERAARSKARRTLANMPSSAEPGRVVSPLPHMDREEYQRGILNVDLNRGIDSAPVHAIPIDRLKGIQATVSRERVASFIDDPDQVERGHRDPEHGGKVDYPIVVQKGEHLFLHDGHHRVIAAKLMGHASIDARLVRVESEPGTMWNGT